MRLGLLRKNDDEDKAIRIVKGQIVDADAVIPDDYVQEERPKLGEIMLATGYITKKKLDNALMMQSGVALDQIPLVKVGCVRTRTGIALAKACTCTCIKDECQDDVDNFRRWLLKRDKADHTIYNYELDIKMWKELLPSKITGEAIQKIIDGLTPYKAHRMYSSLNVYSNYRSAYGDPSLHSLIHASNVVLPEKPKPKLRKELTADQIQMFLNHAIVMCKIGDRTGIFIALILYGVPGKRIREVEIDGNTVKFMFRHNKPKQFEAPEWLINAMNRLGKWRMSHVEVYKRIKRYGVKPSEISGAITNFAGGEKG